MKFCVTTTWVKKLITVNMPKTIKDLTREYNTRLVEKLINKAKYEIDYENELMDFNLLDYMEAK